MAYHFTKVQLEFSSKDGNNYCKKTFTQSISSSVLQVVSKPTTRTINNFQYKIPKSGHPTFHLTYSLKLWYTCITISPQHMRLKLNSCAANQIVFNSTSTKFSSAKQTHYPITSKPKYLVNINNILCCNTLSPKLPLFTIVNITS